MLPVRRVEVLAPLITNVPEGVRAVVVLRPRAWMQNPAARVFIETIFPAARLDTFAERVGIELRDLDELLVAWSGSSTLLIGRGDFDAEEGVERIAARMSALESQVDVERSIRRTGLWGGLRIDALSLDRHTLSMEIGSSRLTGRIVQCRDRNVGCESALETVAAREAWSLAQNAPMLSFLAPEPLGLPLDSDIGQLLAGERAAALSLTIDEEVVHLEATMRGAFPEEAEGAFRRLLASLAASDLGTMLGLSAAMPSYEGLRDEGGMTFAIRIARADLFRAVRLLFAEDIAAVLEHL